MSLKPDYFQFILGFVSIVAGALCGIGLAMALIAAQRSPAPPSPVDTVEIKRTENLSCMSSC